MAEQLQSFPIFPPARGLYRPFEAYSPLVVGAFTFNNWRFRRGALSLVEGIANIGGQTLDNSTNNKLLLTYKSSANRDIVYVNGTSLRYVNITAATETEVQSAIIPADTQVRFSWVEFRNRILIGTTTNGLWWYDPEARTARKAGLSAPGSGPSGAAGSATGLTGAFKGGFTFVNDQGHESSLSPASATVNVTNQKIDWSSISTGPTGVTKRRFYRTVAGGSILLLHSTINDNTTTTITGDATVDTSLGVAGPTDHDIPITNIRQLLATSERVYLVDGGDGITLWASKFDDVAAEPNWEAYPLTLSLEIPFGGGRDTFQAAILLNGEIFAAGRHSIHKIRGDVALGVVVDKTLDFGLFSPYSWVLTPQGLVFLDNNMRLWLWDGENFPTDIGKDIQEILSEIIESQMNGPEMSYDALAHTIHLNYETASGKKALLFDLDTGQFSTADWAFILSHWSEGEKKLYGTIASSSRIKEWSGFKKDGAQYGTQQVEWLPFSPSPGSDIYFGRLKILLRALPIVSFVPPTLRVEVALDGSNLFETKYIDLTKDDFVRAAGNAPLVRAVEVPIYRTGRAVTIRLSSVNNGASLNNGVEIYGISLLGEVLGEVKDKDRSFRSGGSIA